MDPDAYKSHTMPLVSLPPHIPIPSPQDDDEAATPKASWNMNKSVPFLPKTMMMQQEDAIMSSSLTNHNPTPWMSMKDQQPYMHPFDNSWGDVDTPRPNDNAAHYPHPELSLPHPSLTQDFRMAVTLNPRISVGPTPFGLRNWISFTGGTWSGCWGSGIVLPGGQDNQLVLADGSAHLETSYILQTYDNPPAYIVIKTNGWRTGPPEVLAKLADPAQADSVDPNSYKFRLFIEMETGDERYRDKVQYGMWVGSGMRKGAEVIYDAYRIS